MIAVGVVLMIVGAVFGAIVALIALAEESIPAAIVLGFIALGGGLMIAGAVLEQPNKTPLQAEEGK